MSARQLELETVRKRVALGEASPHELLESFQRLLADGDRLVAAQGVLAMEWIGQQARLQAQAEPAEAPEPALAGGTGKPELSEAARAALEASGHGRRTTAQSLAQNGGDDAASEAQVDRSGAVSSRTHGRPLSR